jgi:tetratricopeptide (TPR) repeat protein
VGAKAFGRLEIWKANLQVANDFRALGTGVGTHEGAHQLFLDIDDCDGKVFTHAESGYLQVASETGYAGAIVMFLFIGMSLFWCIGALRDSRNEVRAPAAVIMASLLANLSHAIGDFFWYTPSCTLLLVLQLASAFRLYRNSREASGRSAWTWPMPRIVSLASACGVLVLGSWLADQKLPAAMAEPEYMRYLTLTFQEQPLDEDELRELDADRHQAIIKAARRDPRNARFQELAGIACIEQFDDLQQQSENPLSHAQIRDVVIASKFESQQALHEWLKRAVGQNIRYLQLAKKYFVRALRDSPLCADSYVRLVELEFLQDSDPARSMRYLNQAIKLRPHDAQVLFSVGKNVFLSGEMDDALEYWRKAFHRSRRIQDQITDMLAEHVTPEFFLESFQPDWSGLRPLAEAFDRAGRTDEARVIWEKCLEDGTNHLKSNLSASERETTALILRDAWFGIKEPDRGILVLMEVQRQLPYSMPIRARLAWDLYAAGRYAEAADHLQWCAARSPNKDFQQAAAMAIKYRLKSVAAGHVPDRS